MLAIKLEDPWEAAQVLASGMTSNTTPKAPAMKERHGQQGCIRTETLFSMTVTTIMRQ